MIGYDDLESIQYFGDNMKAWWTKGGTVTMNDALQTASADHDAVMERCTSFDNQLWDDAVKAGGKNYADLCVLAFRQSIAAHKLIKDKEGNTIFPFERKLSAMVRLEQSTYNLPFFPTLPDLQSGFVEGNVDPDFLFLGKW